MQHTAARSKARLIKLGKMSSQIKTKHKTIAQKYEITVWILELTKMHLTTKTIKHYKYSPHTSADIGSKAPPFKNFTCI